MNIVVIGAGLAGAHAAQELRTQGYTGDITLVGDDPHPPYERPPLSKGLLLGTSDPDSVFLHPRSWYAENQVELLTGAPVTDIELDTSHVTLGDRHLSYDRLLLATGAQPRRLPMADCSGADIVYLRTIDDALGLAPRLTERLLIVGAGWIGLEVAAAARQAGGTVTVVESAPLPLVRVLGPEIAPMVVALHRDHGVDRTSQQDADAFPRRPDHWPCAGLTRHTGQKKGRRTPSRPWLPPILPVIPGRSDHSRPLRPQPVSAAVWPLSRRRRPPSTTCPRCSRPCGSPAR